MEAVIYEKSGWLEEADPGKIKLLVESAINKALFTVCAFSEHFFEPLGYSACWVIGESHIAVHTFDEKKITYIQVSSCSKAKFEIFCDIIAMNGDIPYAVIYK